MLRLLVGTEARWLLVFICKFISIKIFGLVLIMG